MTDQRTEQPAADPVQRFARAAGPLILLAATIAMLWWTWFKWPDPVVDFGRELYTAWQISEGKVLYRDIAYFNGPLSPYSTRSCSACSAWASSGSYWRISSPSWRSS